MLDFLREAALNNILPVVITTLVGMIGTGGLFIKALLTLKETGEAITLIATAAEDRKLTKKELLDIKASINDITSIWKKTPKPIAP